VYLVLTYATMLQRPLEQLNRQLQDLQQASAGIYRVQQLLNQHSSLPDTGTRQLPAGPLTLEFDRVTFRYEDGEPALRDVHFRLPAGQHLGLVGRTGSGKTTVARLCSRLYDPSAGSVRLGGIDLRDVPLAEVSRRVAVISQEVHLFRASVRDNVTLFDPRVPDAQINAAIQRVGLGGWLASLPNGLDTQVFAASGLSAGEAQLLALVRVFLRDPGLIILDEATARLDVATERQLEHALAELLQGRTTVIVAHRLTTVQQVDQILVMQEGEVTEDGARAALAANAASRFAALLRMAEVEVVA
jgi:ABC-type multidrug transport system fused ATPase/permease subunit